MSPIPPVALPPITAEYDSTLQQAGSQAPPAQSEYKFSRAADGKTRVDSGTMSMISNPAKAETIVLDHVKKTATVQPAMPPPPPAPPGMPQMPHFAPPAMPGVPPLPAVKVEDLGKRLLQGHEVEGKRFVIPPVAPPALPALQMPGAPKPPAIQLPGAPKPPSLQMPAVPKPPAFQMPGAPKLPPLPATPPLVAPQPPSTAEVWNSTSMAVPMLTKVTGSFGQLTQICKKAVPGEPHPTAFEIPPDYKKMASAPKLPIPS